MMPIFLILLLLSSLIVLTEGSVLAPFIVVFMILFMVTFLVIFPIQIFHFNRKNRNDSSLEKVTEKDALDLPFGVGNPDDALPKWLYVPFLWFLTIQLIQPICLSWLR